MLVSLHGDGDHLLDAACAKVKFRQSFCSGVDHKVPHLVLGQSNHGIVKQLRPTLLKLNETGCLG